MIPKPANQVRFDLAAVTFPTVDGQGCVKVSTNLYSVPLRQGLKVQARTHAGYIEIWHGGECVARHERCFGRYQKVLDWEHYLDALIGKAGALAGSTPLAGELRSVLGGAAAAARQAGGQPRDD